MKVPLSRRFFGVERNSMLSTSEVMYPDKLEWEACIGF